MSVELASSSRGGVGSLGSVDGSGGGGGGDTAASTGADVIKGLAAAGICTYRDILSAGPLASAPGVAPKEVARLSLSVAAQHSPPAVSALTLFDALPSTVFGDAIATGCAALDEALGGKGLLRGELIEVAGRAGSGKTQLCLTAVLAVAAAGENVVIIGSGAAAGSGIARRLQNMCEARGLADWVGILKRITLLPAFSAQELLAQLAKVKSAVSVAVSATMEQQQRHASSLPLPPPPRLLVVDSLGDLLGPEFGHGHFRGQALLSHTITDLRALTFQDGMTGSMMVQQTYQLGRAVVNFCGNAGLGCTTIVTNSVTLPTSDWGGKVHPRPSMGASWTYMPTTRLILHRYNEEEKGNTAAAAVHYHESARVVAGSKKDRKEEGQGVIRALLLDKSPYQVVGESSYVCLSAAGLCDV